MAMNNVNNGDIPECPPGPAKTRPETSMRPRSNLQEEPACARCLFQQHCRDPNGPIVECPDAPTKGSSRESILGIKENGLSKNDRLNRNRREMPRPVHSRGRRNIIRQLRLARENDEAIPECLPAPVKRRPDSRRRHTSSLQEESACVRSLFHHGGGNPNGPVLECPGAPTKKGQSSMRPRSNLQEEPVCARSLLQGCGNINGPVVECPGAPIKGSSKESGLRTKEDGVRKTVRLSANRGILPRPFQSRARRNINRLPRIARNIVRIMGVDDHAQNWINLDTIYEEPLNRAGNPAAPSRPRKSKEEFQLRLHVLARQMTPRILDFGSIDNESDSEDNEDSGYDGRRDSLSQ